MMCKTYNHVTTKKGDKNSQQHDPYTIARIFNSRRKCIITTWFQG